MATSTRSQLVFGLLLGLLLLCAVQQSHARPETLFSQPFAPDSVITVCLSNNFGEYWELTFSGEQVAGNVVVRGQRDFLDPAFGVYSLASESFHLTTTQSDGTFALTEQGTWDFAAGSGASTYASSSGFGNTNWFETSCLQSADDLPGTTSQRTVAPPFTPDGAITVCAESSDGAAYALTYTGEREGQIYIMRGTTTTADGVWETFAIQNLNDGSLSLTAYDRPNATLPQAITSFGTFDVAAGVGSDINYVSDVDSGGSVTITEVACP